MLGCLVAGVVMAVGLTLLAVLGIFLEQVYPSFLIDTMGPEVEGPAHVNPFVFGEDWGLLQGLIALFGLAFFLLIAYTAIKSFRS